MSEKKFTIARPERRAEAPSTEVDRLIAGAEPETTKTIRIPLRLSLKLKIHAAETGQTEKEILIRLIAEYLESK